MVYKHRFRSLGKRLLPICIAGALLAIVVMIPWDTEARRQYDNVQKLQDAGFKIDFAGRGSAKAEVIGVDSTSIRVPHIIEEHIDAIASFAELRFLKLHHLDTALANIAKLSNLRQLREVQFSGAAANDETIFWIRDLTELRILDLRRTKLTDFGMINLRELLQLRRVYLPDTVSDAGLFNLRRLGHLKFIEAPACTSIAEGQPRPFSSYTETLPTTDAFPYDHFQY